MQGLWEATLGYFRECSMQTHSRHHEQQVNDRSRRYLELPKTSTLHNGQTCL